MRVQREMGRKNCGKIFSLPNFSDCGAYMALGAEIWSLGGGGEWGKKKKTLSLSFHKKKRSRKAAPCRADCGGAHLSRLGFAVAYLHQLWFAWCLRSRPLHGRKMSLPFQINIFQPSTRTPPSSGWGGGGEKKNQRAKKKNKIIIPPFIKRRIPDTVAW